MFTKKHTIAIIIAGTACVVNLSANAADSTDVTFTGALTSTTCQLDVGQAAIAFPTTLTAKDILQSSTPRKKNDFGAVPIVLTATGCDAKTSLGLTVSSSNIVGSGAGSDALIANSTDAGYSVGLAAEIFDDNGKVLSAIHSGESGTTTLANCSTNDTCALATTDDSGTATWALNTEMVDSTSTPVTPGKYSANATFQVIYK